MKRLYLFYTFLLFTYVSASFAFDLQHTKWNQILSTYVTEKDGQTLFNYKELKANKARMEKLELYLEELSNFSQKSYNKLSTPQKFSFLVNAYNAFTVKLIVNNYPLDSIRDIGLLPGAAWRKDFFKLFGKKTDLGYIEHELLRKKFNEPRLHFVINCASIGCPNLPVKALNAENMEAILVKSETEFFKQKSKNNINTAKKTVYVSKIFDWFEDDFKKKYGSLKKYLSQVFQNDKILKENYKVKYTDYDWALNEAK